MTQEHPGEIVVGPDTTAKINLTLLGTVIVALVTAAVYVANLSSSVDRMDGTLRDIRATMERLDARLDIEQRNVHGLQLQLEAIQSRVERLESRDK